MKPILFLDIDGVISSIRNQIVGIDYDVVAVMLLKQLQDKIGFIIVLSSARRKLFKSADEFNQHLYNEVGVTLNIHDNFRTVTGVSTNVADYDTSEDTNEYWRTMNNKTEPLDKCNTKYWRGWEIQQWLNEYKDEHGEIPAYAYIDDSRDLYPLDPSRYIHVDQGETTAIGLNHYDQLLAVFKEQLSDEQNRVP